jgi:hypothetical protein
MSILLYSSIPIDKHRQCADYYELPPQVKRLAGYFTSRLISNDGFIKPGPPTGYVPLDNVVLPYIVKLKKKRGSFTRRGYQLFKRS